MKEQFSVDGFFKPVEISNIARYQQACDFSSVHVRVRALRELAPDDLLLNSVCLRPDCLFRRSMKHSATVPRNKLIIIIDQSLSAERNVESRATAGRPAFIASTVIPSFHQEQLVHGPSSPSVRRSHAAGSSPNPLGLVSPCMHKVHAAETSLLFVRRRAETAAVIYGSWVHGSRAGSLARSNQWD